MSKTILLADDSLTIQKVVELTFMEEDFDVVSVSDGDHAIAKLEEFTPALVIANVHMPGASGFDICRQVKTAHPKVPVLLLVGTFELFDEEEARTAGADAHLKKPFDSQELLQMVEGLVGSVAAPDAVVETELEPIVPEEIPLASAKLEPVAEEMAVASAGIPPTPEPVAPPVEEEPPATPAPASPAAVAAADPQLSEEDVERIARKVVEYLGEDIVREISWEVIPDLAEIVIKSRLRELEEQVD
jgi:CheY-like chemotaxis protein